MSKDKLSTEIAPQQGSGGFMTQARDMGIPPSVLAEQQRAKTEIEAALTVAASMPRDEKRAMDAILVSCQREGLAAKSQYQYSRGGTDISGASIVLMEAIAQRWGNIDFGFRELSRYPARGKEPGQSTVEAYAWDLESNTRRKVQFTVEHAMKAKGRVKLLTDPRDIYEYVANQSQRRVRTCLENIIPRDIVEAACEQCNETLKAEIKDVKESTQKMLQAFADLDVTQAMVEARIQRHLEAITSAQIISLRKIYTSIKDGISSAEDWFDMSEAEAKQEKTTVADKAKEAMRKKADETAPKQARDETPSSPQAAEREHIKVAIEQACDEMGKVETIDEIKAVDSTFAAREDVTDAAKRLVHATAGARIKELELFPSPQEEPTSEAKTEKPEPEKTSTKPKEEPDTPDCAEQVAQWLVDLEEVETIRGLKQAREGIPAAWPEDAKEMIRAKINTRIDKLRGTKDGQ